VDVRERGAGVARHPWELARAEFFRALIARHVELGAVTTVLDAGAGDGWFAQELLADLCTEAAVICWDVNYRSADLAAPSDPRIRRTTTRPEGSFDLILALDVLEHLDDAEAFLGDVLVPSLAGILVVSVPAHPRLFSDHDRMLEHRRRYRRRDLLDLLARHVEVRESGTLFSSLLLPRAISVAAERLGRSASPSGIGNWSGGPRTTRLITSGLGIDARLGQRLGQRGVVLPGLSAWAVCGRRTP
jgi:SAM-dependent methyltransferase